MIVSLGRQDCSPALLAMPARHAVLLTPLECSVPIIMLYSKQRQPITPLESALTSHSQPTENTATLSPVECALTRLSPATPLECAVPKKQGGRGSFFPLFSASKAVGGNEFAPSKAEGPLSPISHPLSPLFSYSCVLFCALLHFFARTKNSTLFFSIASALFGKNAPGWGTPFLLSSRLASREAS